jgi:hypothetical protein
MQHRLPARREDEVEPLGVHVCVFLIPVLRSREPRRLSEGAQGTEEQNCRRAAIG